MHKETVLPEIRSERLTLVSNESSTDLFLRARDPLISQMRDQTAVLQRIENSLNKPEVDDQDVLEWKQLSRVLDRVFLFLYIFISIVTSSVFLGIMSGSSWRH